MLHRFSDPRSVQAGLGLVAVAYIAAWLLAPQWVPHAGLWVVLALGLAGGVYTFIIYLRPVQPRAPEAGSISPVVPAAAAETVPEPAERTSTFSPEALQFVRHQRDLLAEAEQLVLAGGDEAAAGFRLYDSERHNIAAGHALAASVTDPVELLELVRGYPLAGANVLAGRQKACERTAWLRAACAAAQQLGPAGAEATFLLDMGNAYLRGGHARRAFRYYDLSLRASQINGERRAEAAALAKIAVAHAAARNPLRALVYYQRQQQIVREWGDRAAEARISWNIGLAYAELGDLTKAIAAMRFCVDYEREIGHPEAEADAASLERLRARQRAIDGYWASRPSKRVPG